jgi:hypothetical protein
MVAELLLAEVLATIAEPVVTCPVKVYQPALEILAL